MIYCIGAEIYSKDGKFVKNSAATEEDGIREENSQAVTTAAKSFVTSKTKSNHVTAMTPGSAAKRHDDLMIISTERSGNVKRLNVSITRAQSLMIAVGVADMLERNDS
ncbi:hypothetical protein pipiens_010536 [Culex pipiens pipiens]|uniref:Uncharacterized protein n=1 Tax=Culex pipiens pipiens TaxID=38569 RepID=A0ABD1D9S3_CULPP